LFYKSFTTPVPGIKEGILLEVGFDTVSPNQPVTITSWAFDKASTTPTIQITDNRAFQVTCYNPEYTFVEKLQTIATKYRKEQEGASTSANFMRQYYDVYCLLDDERVQQFIGTPGYQEHKQKRFPAADNNIPIAENQAFLLDSPAVRADYQKRYQGTANLDYQGQPSFDVILARIRQYIGRL
jgi:hypothetical protein